MTLRIRPRIIALAAAALGACSSDSTAPLTTTSAASLAADQFTRLADSVSRSGGDADVGNAYSSIAGVLRAGGRVSSIVITIDGAATTFTATALGTELGYSSSCVGTACAARPKPVLMRSLVAWDAANPKRVVQLTAQSDDEPIAAMLYPTLLASYAPMASLVYMDGAGGTYFGTSGSQKMGETVSTTPCAVARDSVPVATKLPSTCTQADFSIAFSAKAEPSAFLVRDNTAKGTHAIAMTTQTVAGSHTLLVPPTCDTACAPGSPNGPPSVPPPPVVVRPSSELPASLSATMDSLVTLTFTLKNPSSDAIKVTFPSGQRYDFIATDSTTGRDVWRWSADKSFTQALSEQTVPANGTLVFIAQWKPAAKSRYLLHGLLVSTSHRGEAYASVVVR